MKLKDFKTLLDVREQYRQALSDSDDMLLIEMKHDHLSKLMQLFCSYQTLDEFFRTPNGEKPLFIIT